MSTAYLFIHLREHDFHWKYYNDAAPLQAGPASTLRQWLDSQPAEWVMPTIIALAPAEDILLTHAQISGKQLRHKDTVLPYLIEDQLAADIADMHIVAGPQSEGNRFVLAAVSHARMQAWLEQLRGCAIVPDLLTSELFGLPFDNTGWHAALEKGRALVRTERYNGICLRADRLGNLLDLIAGDTRPDFLHVWVPREEAPALMQSELPVPGELHVLDSSVSDFLCGQFMVSHAMPAAINLLQGRYRVAKKRAGSWREWKKVAVLCIAWFVLQWVITTGSALYFQSRAYVLERESVGIYHTLFPQESKIVDLRAQMQNHLSERNPLAADGFLLSLSNMAAALNGDGIAIQGLAYHAENNVTAVDVQAKDFEALEKFRLALSQGQLAARIVSSVQDNARVRAQLIIEAKP